MIEKIIIVALFSYGWCTAFSKGNIFEAVGEWLKKRLPEYIQKPLFLCSVCNAFWVATGMYWLFWGDYWVHWMMIGVASSGTNAIFVTLFNKLDDLANAVDPPQEE